MLDKFIFDIAILAESATSKMLDKIIFKVLLENHIPRLSGQTEDMTNYRESITHSEHQLIRD